MADSMASGNFKKLNPETWAQDLCHLPLQRGRHQPRCGRQGPQFGDRGRKWKGLRDTNLKEKERSGSASKRWSYSEVLSFLDAFVTHKKTSSYMGQRVEEDRTAENNTPQDGVEPLLPTGSVALQDSQPFVQGNHHMSAFGEECLKSFDHEAVRCSVVLLAR
ncbi:unnamed protein product [Pleuronectes platessa]|uniref:Uncharacterized protein n=1 Tax=Pleuronectes platessa TaxID=8262 RepID=A0A9N7YEL6_PLEPL|nr:unnamed protein product [Pleuronectes platessa]